MIAEPTDQLKLSVDVSETRPFTSTVIATEMPAAIRPYSIAVSFKNRVNSVCMEMHVSCKLGTGPKLGKDYRSATNSIA